MQANGHTSVDIGNINLSAPQECVRIIPAKERYHRNEGVQVFIQLKNLNFFEKDLIN